MRSLDLIVTSDSMLAHLAGALRRPTCLLLRHDNPDWRWLLNRDDTPWYPETRLFRQTIEGDWDSVMARVAAVVREWRSPAQQ
jgi:ADP-heptose:LPS heptosyltransferase